jgi:peptidoglycan/LPS O-acetylase OafA/YrhL
VQTSSARNLGIDQLRGVAILLVMLHHLGSLVPWSGTWVNALIRGTEPWGGVDLFFVISGYVVSKGLIAGTWQGRTSNISRIKRFYRRRSVRILPVAWLGLAVTAIFIEFRNPNNRFVSSSDTWHGILASYVFLANTAPPQRGFGLVTQYWSLSLEEQFYLLVPVFLLVFRKFRYRIGVLVLLSLAYIATPSGDSGRLFYFRALGLFFGVMLALFEIKYGWTRKRSTKKVQFLCWVAIFGIATAPALFDSPWQQIWGVQPSIIVSILGLILVTFATTTTPVLLSPSWISASLHFFGRRSYSIYVFHYVCFVATRDLWSSFADVPNTLSEKSLFFAIAASMVFLVVEFVYRAVELPTQRRSQKRLFIIGRGGGGSS